MITEHPITKIVHNSWRKRIAGEFSELNITDNGNYLSLIKYVDRAPEKFYNKKALHVYQLFLEQTLVQNPTLLENLLSEHKTEISGANKTLTEVNEKQIHDKLFPETDIELFDFIDKEIHYNYLKVLEGSFYQFLLIVAKASRIQRGKSTEKLDLYNVVEELKNGSFSFLTELYNGTIRNGIAHGKVIFGDTEIMYIDKKEKVSIATKEIIRKFDNLLDCVNAFALALKLFCYGKLNSNADTLALTPSSFLMEELQATVDGPAWKIVNCLDSVHGPVGKKQLMIYIECDFWDFNKVQFNCFFTAIMAEKFSNGYDRFFLSIKSKHAYAGWAAFNGAKLKSARETGDNTLYADVLEDKLLFFVPKLKFPKIIYKLGSIYMSFKTVMPLTWKQSMEKFSKPFYIRDVKSHTKKFYTVVEDPSIVIKKEHQASIIKVVRNNYKIIVNSVIKKARKEASILNGVRYKPVKYIRVFVYESDLRVRKLRYSGLIEELVCTIGFNTSDKIPDIDIIGGTPEQIGKYRIVWNKKWLDKNPAILSS